MRLDYNVLYYLRRGEEMIDNYLISTLEIKLIQKTISKLYQETKCNVNDIITDEDITDLLDQLQNIETKFDLCSTLESINYVFSIILSEIRQEKRNVVNAIFQTKPKLAEEKSVLEKKLDAEPEYSALKTQEEYLFNFLNHLKEVKNTVTWMVKENEE